MAKRDIKIDDVSAANLPEDLQINNPRHFIKEMRTTYLKNIRLKLKMTEEEVAKECDIEIDELQSIEAGSVNTNHMMALHALSEFYKIDHHRLLSLFNLLERKPTENRYGLAASHRKEVDKKTQKELEAFIENFKE